VMFDGCMYGNLWRLPCWFRSGEGRRYTLSRPRSWLVMFDFRASEL